MNFIHNGARGDIIYSLPTVIKLGGGNFYFRKKGHFFDLQRLLEAQDYIQSATYWDKIAPIDYNLDLFHEGFQVTPQKHISTYYLEAFKVDFDLGIQWIHNIQPFHIADLVIQRTRRYHDKEDINWRLLRPFTDRCIFMGYEADYEIFRKRAKTDMRHTKCVDMLQMAQIIKGSKLFIGNQGIAFALAEAMKHPRVLETYYKKDNCRPNGKDAYTYLTENLIEQHIS